MNRLLCMIPLVMLVACVPEDDVASQSESLTTTPKVVSLFAERGPRVIPVTTRDLTPQERQAHDFAVTSAGSQGAASLSCTSGGGCNSQGCWSWAICHGDGLVAVANCTSTSGCTVNVYD
jgi:hypothetical protein